MLHDPAPEARMKALTVDERLRAGGFTIAQRAGECEAWWLSSRGEIMLESTALEELEVDRAERDAMKNEKGRRCPGR